MWSFESWLCDAIFKMREGMENEAEEMTDPLGWSRGVLRKLSCMIICI